MLVTPQASAYRILDAFDFTDGAEWEFVAVSLYNYAPVEQNVAYKTFVVRDTALFQEMQQTWDFPLMFDDVCDYHYALKIYRNRQLVKTLLVNLRCAYLTDGSFSYSFNPVLFEQLAAKRQNLVWSYIDFTQLPRIRKAIDKLSGQPNVYFYHDTTPYQYDGYFYYGAPDQSIRVDRDSLRAAVRVDVAATAGVSEDSVLVKLHYFSLTDSETLFFRYQVYCSEAIADRYRAQKPQHVRIRWRDHFAFENSIQLVVVGVSERRYRYLVDGVQLSGAPEGE